MKKIAGLIISLLAVASLTGCEFADELPNGDNQQQNQTQTPDNNNNQGSGENNQSGDNNQSGGENNNNNNQGGGDNNQNQGSGDNNQQTGGDNNQQGGDNNQQSGDNNQGGDNNQQGGDQGGDETPASGWTTEELALINQYLYGTEIPFIPMGSEKLYYDYEYYCLCKSLDNATYPDLVAAAVNYKNNASWTNVGDVEDRFDLYYLKQVEYNNQTRYVLVNIYILDSEGYTITSDTATGTLYADIYDPYLYEWPAGDLASFFGSEFPCPAGEGLLFTYSLEGNLENGFYLSVEAIGVSGANFLAYVTAIKTAGWNLEEDETYSYYVITDEMYLSVEYSVSDATVSIFAFTFPD